MKISILVCYFLLLSIFSTAQESDLATIVTYRSDDNGNFVYHEEYVHLATDPRFTKRYLYEQPHWTYNQNAQACDISKFQLPSSTQIEASFLYSKQDPFALSNQPSYIPTKSLLDCHLSINVTYQDVYQVPNPLRMNKEALCAYIMQTYPTFTQALDNPQLYLNKHFIPWAQQSPYYHYYVEKHYKQCISYSTLKKLCLHLIGNYVYGTTSRFKQLYQQCQLQELERLHKKIASINKKEHYHLDRMEAITDVLEKKEKTIETIAITHSAKTFAHVYDVAPTLLLPKSMNAYQLQLHKEFCDQLNQAAQLRYIADKAPEYQIFIDAVGYGVACGIQANNDLHTRSATLWADFGWKALSIASAVAQGILSGAKNAVTSVANIALHPIETVESLAQGIGMLGLLIGKTYAHLIRCELSLQRGDENDVRGQVHQTISIANAVITHYTSELSRTSFEDTLKNGVAIATEFIVAPYVFKAMHGLCTKVRPVAAGIMHALQDEQNIERFNTSSIGKAVKTIREGVEKGAEKVAKTVKVGLGPLIPEIANSYDHIVAALNKVDSNKIHHILTLETKKHAWHRIIEDEVTWEKVKNVIKKVMMEGEISPRDPIFKKSLLICNETVEVVFAPRSDNTISIVDAWVKTI